MHKLIEKPVNYCPCCSGVNIRKGSTVNGIEYFQCLNCMCDIVFKLWNNVDDFYDGYVNYRI